MTACERKKTALCLKKQLFVAHFTGNCYEKAWVEVLFAAARTV
jgi:hypothetical protein